MKLRRSRRRGATLVESAFVYPVMFLILFGIIVLGIAVFRYQQVAHAAREGARYASVHGSKYATDVSVQTNTTVAAATASDVYTNAIQPELLGFDSNDVSYTVTWNTSNAQTHLYTTPVSTTYPQGNVVDISNTVTVTVTYTWRPLAYFGGFTLSSSSTSLMHF